MSRFRAAWIASILLVLGCMNSGPAPEPTRDASSYHLTLAEMGAEIYTRSCAACHGADATGSGPVAGSLRIPPADLTRIAARRGGEFPDGEIARFIDGRFETAAHGTRDMPVWGERFGQQIPEAILSEEFSRGKIATLIEYLKSIQRSE